MKKRNILISIASGMLLGLSFPPYPFPLLAFIGLIPILFLFETEERIISKFKLLYITFFVYHGLTNWWISSWRAETDPYLMVSGIAVWLAHPFYLMLPFAIYFFIKKRLGSNIALWSFPAFWVCIEWIHSLGEISYPWLTIGNSQIYNYYWVQFIDITGVWGASFLIVMANVLILKMILNYRTSLEQFNFKRFFFAKNINLTIFLLAIIILPNIYGLIRTQDFVHNDLMKTHKSLNVGVIQPNIDPWQKWKSDPMKQIELHQQIQDSLVKSFPNLDLCIWSETAIPSVSIMINQAHFYPFLQEWLDKQQVSLLTGFSEYYIYPKASEAPPTARDWVLDSSKKWEPFNAALLLNPVPFGKTNPQIYRKSRLTPFAERLPYADKIAFAQSWFKWGVGISSWGVGREQYALNVKNKEKTAKLGAVICIESIYPDFVAGFVRKGANILSVITNDAWYDFTTGPEQHYQIAAMRAIETRRYIARCANTGVSGFITPTGKSLVRAEHYQRTAVAASLPLLEEHSLYVQYGDWLAESLSFITLALIISGFFATLRMNKKQ